MEKLKKVTLTGKQFAHIMTLCSVATAKNGVRPLLEAIHFDVVGDSVTAVALDGFILTKVQVKCAESASDDFSFNMLPIKPNKKAEYVNLELAGKDLIITENGNTPLTVPIIEDDFPAYNQIIPTDYSEGGLVCFDAAFITKLLSPYSKTGAANNCVEFSFSINRGEINAKAPLLITQNTKLGKVQSIILPVRKL